MKLTQEIITKAAEFMSWSEEKVLDYTKDCSKDEVVRILRKKVAIEHFDNDFTRTDLIDVELYEIEHDVEFGDFWNEEEDPDNYDDDSEIRYAYAYPKFLSI